MDVLDIMKGISIPSPTKIIFIVIDGLGGLPDPKTGKTELDTALTPNLDKLSVNGTCGMVQPVSPGITPGSVPGYLALFGFNPIEYNVGRGAIEALGINFNLQAEDVVARGNFATMTEDGIIEDRRAGRISTVKCTRLCKLLDGIEIEDISIIVRPVKEHRFVAVFRGNGLASGITDSDPQLNGVAPKEVIALSIPAEKTARVVNAFIKQVRGILRKNHPANMILLRGFSKRPLLPTMNEIYKLKSAAIATYPMYRGMAQLLGMDLLNSGNSIEEEFETLKNYYTDYDFFFIHIKEVDTAGEDGNFKKKVKLIERVDSALSIIRALGVDVVIITGDHSTPAILAGHSWHDVPILLNSRWCRPDKVSKFSESSCAHGGLGQIHATQIMPLAMSNALKLNKFGA